MFTDMDFKRIILYTISFSLWITLSSAQDCQFANFNVKPNFNLEKYLGKWYEMKWLAQNFIPEEFLFQDYAHNYVLESNGTITAFIKGRDPSKPDRCFRYAAWLTRTNTPGKLRYRRFINDSAQITSDYWVMMTDYDNYAFVYGCRVPFENGTCNEADSWVWSRTGSLPESTMKLITQKMNEVCVNSTKYLATRQDNECPECRYKLTEVVKNFDMKKYAGNWYKLRIYKQNASAGFTPKSTIHNYKVRDETGLDLTITNRNMDGICSTRTEFLRKTNSSAKFVLEQNKGTALEGLIERDHWIMWTDYDKYSVVYSCLVPGDNFTCSQAELTVMGRTTSLFPLEWAMIKKKVINVCLYQNDYVDVNHNKDCSTGGSRRIGHQGTVEYLTAIIFILIWKL